MTGLDRNDIKVEKLYTEVTTAVWCSGYYAKLLLIGCGFDVTDLLNELSTKLQQKSRHPCYAQTIQA